jgi:signal transduction histidine kinase
MSNNHISSSEFVSLCQSQIKLLSQSLGALWSVVYLTEEIGEGTAQAQLFPFAIYPQAHDRDVGELRGLQLSEIWQGLQSHSLARLLPDSLTEHDSESAKYNQQSESMATKQLILPLFHQETFLGLLIAAREDRDWQPNELEQVEEIARTIAIARFIELQYHWTQGELNVQKNLRRVEHDRLDNLLHQLRNPLTALRTFGKLFLKRLLPEDGNRELAQSILAQSDRFQALLEQFEAESRLDTIVSSASDVHGSWQQLEKGNDNLDRSSFLLPSSLTELTSIDLKPILEPLLQTATAIALEREIELLDCLPPDIPKVRGDVSALREILNNLIDNALKYTPAGGKVRLTLELSKYAMLGIAIADTGYGIPATDRERIFERHYRGIQAQSNIPGTGLGLAIASELVVKMQGEIEIISPNNLSEDSPGTTFIVWLPIFKP